MESNKEQAQRCIEMAELALKVGDYEKAEKFLKKSQSLYPLARAELLLRRRKASNPTGSGAETGPTAPKDYTQEQVDVVKRVQRCKDFYEVLGVSQDATDSDVKKSYKKLALQLHPDKNKAPGALEAFKSLGNAVETLTDAAKRKAYDLYRTRHPGSSAEAGSRFSGARNGYTQNDFRFQEVNPDNIFNMFFGGMYQQQQQHQHNQFSRARNGRNTQYGDGNGGQINLFYLVVVMVVVVSVLSSFFASDPLYSLQHTNKYTVERRTLNLKIPYYVKTNFLNEYQGSIARLEYSVEEEYVTYMKRTCSNERTYRDAMIGRAKSFGSRAQFQQAQQLKMPACDALYRLGIGVVHY